MGYLVLVNKGDFTENAQYFNDQNIFKFDLKSTGSRSSNGLQWVNL